MSSYSTSEPQDRSPDATTNGEPDTSTDEKKCRFGFIGCGNMSRALLNGFLDKGIVEPKNIIVSAPSNKNLQSLHLKTPQIRITNSNVEVVKESDVVFLCVKPHIVHMVLSDLRSATQISTEPKFILGNPLFVSVVPGLTIEKLQTTLSPMFDNPRVIRAMPNTPCLVSQGCCVYSLGSHVEAEDGKYIKMVLSSVGVCEEVPEPQIDAVCGLAGSGPAYIYAAIEAMADGGVKMGLPRSLSLLLAAQTVKGAATMVLETGKHPAQLKDEVCSPGGTTITAMHTLEKNGLRNALISAVEAAAVKSKQLGLTL